MNKNIMKKAHTTVRNGGQHKLNPYNTKDYKYKTTEKVSRNRYSYL